MTAAVVVAGATVIGLLLRLLYWDLPPESDETAAYLLYCYDHSRPLVDFLARYPLPNHHGLHGLAVVLMSLLFEPDFPWIRLPALLAGTVAVPLTFYSLRLWMGRLPAVIAAVLMACSVWGVYYSVNARGYTMGICFVLVAVWCAGRATTGRPWWLYSGAGLALGAAIYTIHTTLYAAIGLACWFAWRWVLHREARTHVRTAALTVFASTGLSLALLFGPIIAHGEARHVIGNAFVVPLPWGEVLEGFSSQLRAAAEMIGNGLLPVPALWTAAVCGVVVAIARRRGNERGELGVLPVLMLLVVPPAILLQRVLPPVRTLTYLLPFAYGLAGLGIVAVCARAQQVLAGLRVPIRYGLLAPALVMVMAALGHRLEGLPRHAGMPLLPDPRFEGAIDAAARVTDPGDVIFAQHWINPLVRYRLRQAGRIEQRVCFPKPDVKRVVVFWHPQWTLDDNAMRVLGSYEPERVLFDNGWEQIIRLTRRDEARFAEAPRIGRRTVDRAPEGLKPLEGSPVAVGRETE